MSTRWRLSSVFGFKFIRVVAVNGTVIVLGGFFSYMPIERIRLADAFFLRLCAYVILDFVIQCTYVLIFQFRMLDFLKMAS